MRDAFRTGAAVGLFLALPLALWWAAQDLAFPPGAPLGESPLALGIRALWIGQAVALPLFGLSHKPDTARGTALAEPLYAVWVPLPFYVLPWLSGALSAGTLARGLFALSAYGVCLTAAGWLSEKTIQHRAIRRIAGSSALLLVAVLAWKHRGLWLSWLER